MALNIARHLRFFRHGHSYHGTRLFRHFGSTVQQRVPNEAGEVTENPQGVEPATNNGLNKEIWKLNGEVSGFQKEITRLDGWNKYIIAFGVGTVLVGIGGTFFKILTYDREKEMEMKIYVKELVTNSEKAMECRMQIMESRMQIMESCILTAINARDAKRWW
ncbi:hypothetical protein BGX38DRAFT_1213677 [Terfezia claveryi]|nr:hypothetical protein BGX38DRAFT_1213677 [Terfezia claveryi]